MTPLPCLREGSLNHSQEKTKMGNLATPKQLAYIERLASDCSATIQQPLDELTVEDASRIIDQLLDQTGQKGRTANRKKRDNWGNGARIGLAFKVCYQRWINSGTNIFTHKDDFTQNVIATYELLNEIAKKVEAA